MANSRLDEYRTFLEQKGVRLRTLGIADIGLERQDALMAVKMIQSASCPILGGDVYFERDSVLELAYANWHTDQRDNETWEAYLQRSWASATAYISTFPRRPDVKSLFSLVVQA